jgi:CBS domain-containing protein
MNSATIHTTQFPSLSSTDTVADATRQMLEHRVSDLPVVDGAGALVGMFRLDRLFAGLLPKAALIGYGVPDLAFVNDTLGQLRERMREIGHLPVHEFVVRPRGVAHPDTPPLELVLLLYQGVNNIPVVERDGGRLVGMVSARDLLNALRTGGTP